MRVESCGAPFESGRQLSHPWRQSFSPLPTTSLDVLQITAPLSNGPVVNAAGQNSARPYRNTESAITDNCEARRAGFLLATRCHSLSDAMRVSSARSGATKWGARERRKVVRRRLLQEENLAILCFIDQGGGSLFILMPAAAAAISGALEHEEEDVGNAPVARSSPRRLPGLREACAPGKADVVERAHSRGRRP
ncbi:hypothetical protein MRX96_027096 [Rhipicephalus microplus]